LKVAVKEEQWLRLATWSDWTMAPYSDSQRELNLVALSVLQSVKGSCLGSEMAIDLEISRGFLSGGLAKPKAKL
jgi:hypothetical protein